MCEEGVFCHCLGTENNLLSCCLVMHNKIVDDKYPFKGEQKFRDQSYVFFCFLFYVVENGANNGVGQWCKTTRGVKFSKLSILLLIIDCLKSVLIKEMDVRMNAKRCSQCFIDFKSSTTLKSRIEHWSSIGF